MGVAQNVFKVNDKDTRKSRRYRRHFVHPVHQASVFLGNFEHLFK